MLMLQCFRKSILGKQFRCNIIIKNKMSSRPILYYDDVSPPARFVLMTASYLDVQMQLHKIDLFQNENRTAEYKKINSLLKVPALTVDKDTTIVDSHAICLYLCQSKNDFRLYPENPLSRARVHEMMFYNSSTLFPIDSAIFTDYFAGKNIDGNLLNSWNDALAFLECRLNNHQWISGNEMMLSDICCAATITSLQLIIPAEAKHKNISKWLQQMKQQPFYEINEIGLRRLQTFVNLLKS